MGKGCANRPIGDEGDAVVKVSCKCSPKAENDMVKLHHIIFSLRRARREQYDRDPHSRTYLRCKVGIDGVQQVEREAFGKGLEKHLHLQETSWFSSRKTEDKTKLD